MPFLARSDPVQVVILYSMAGNSFCLETNCHDMIVDVQQHTDNDGKDGEVVEQGMQVSRAVSAMVNHLDDWGVLEGSW